MALTYLERHEIDSAKWDACLASNPLSEMLFAYSGYLDIACNQWSALVLDDYVSVMPLPWRKKFGIYYIYPPYFLSGLGIFGKEIKHDEFQKWIAAIPLKFQWIDLLLHESFPNQIQNFSGIRHKTFTLDCSLSYQELKQAYHKNHKRNCQKASEEDLKIVNNFSFLEAINLFRENQAKMFKAGYKSVDYERLMFLLHYLQKNRQLESFGVLDANGSLCAAVFFPYLHGKYYFLFSGRNSVSNQNRAMFLLLDTFIQQHAEKSCTLIFNGSDNLQIAKFYHGFGAKEQSFFQLQITRLNPFLKLGFSIYRKLR
jgi:hypothetical protein